MPRRYVVSGLNAAGLAVEQEMEAENVDAARRLGEQRGLRFVQARPARRDTSAQGGAQSSTEKGRHRSR